jgi:glycosyltransferase involved in cell wall biosynthesis
MLNPGLVGLGILDAFAAGIPLITTDCGLHSPEIAYLESGQNGLMTADTVQAFSGACSGLLADSEALRRMGEAAKACASIYNIQHMTQRFGDGILAALETPAT